MQIGMLNLKGEYRRLKSEIDEAVRVVMERGSYIMGPEVNIFEENLAEYLSVKNAVSVASGSDALLISLHALGIGPGVKVILPAFTFFATAGAVVRLGAVPVFVDIDAGTFNLDLNQVENLLQTDPAIRCIIPVHLFGLCCDMERLMDLADQYRIYIIEDACQAINADVRCKGRIKKAGTIGHAGCFSFFPTKNLGGYGDGGMIVTDSNEAAEKMRVLRAHGANPKYYHKSMGYNSRLDTLQAAILNVKLQYLNEWTAKRREVAQSYNREFQASGIDEHLMTPPVSEGHVFHQYMIRVSKRDELSNYLKVKGIATSIYYPLPLHLQECFGYLQYKVGDFPSAEKACREVLALPIDPELTLEQIKYITAAIKEFFEGEKK